MMRQQLSALLASLARRTGRALATLTLLAGLGGLAACEEQVRVVHIGSKDFTESMILAELMALAAEQDGIVVHRTIPYGRSDVVFEAIRQGKLDAYPEYNGTGLVYLGQPPLTDGDESMARVRTLYKDLGITWLDRFGFSNDYVIVMRPEVANSLDIETLSDLADQPSVSFATDVTFTQRPLDGLGAMVRRYGIEESGSVAFPLADGGKADIVRTLLDDEVLAAEMFRTDPQIAEFDLLVLEDDLNFFPVYQPAPLVRQPVLDAFPSLAGALAKTKGAVTADEMRDMITEVELEGRSARAVALDFLVEKGVIEATPSGGGGGADLVIALGDLDSLSGPAGRAVRATRAALPQRGIEIRRTSDPLVLVSSGRARLGVVSAESFYPVDGNTSTPSEKAEALGVVGYRLVHVLTPASGPDSLADVGKLGVGETGGASDRTARMVLNGLGIDGVELISGESGDIQAQFEAMSKGLVDAILVLAPVGDNTVFELTEDGGYKLIHLNGWTEGSAPLRYAFLRPAIIPDGTYDGQDDEVETLSAQIVLIGPPSTREAFGAQGPGTTGTATTQPIAADTVLKLNEALGSAEEVDPAIPMASVLRPTLPLEPQPLVADPVTSIVNLLVVIFVAWLVYLLFARAPRRKPRRR